MSQIVNPVYLDLSAKDQRSIVLRPLLLHVSPGSVRKVRPPKAWMTLEVSLHEDPTTPRLFRIRTTWTRLSDGVIVSKKVQRT